jgi:Caspase domain
LDRAPKRTQCAVRINETIDSERAAKDAMVRYSAQAIVYGTTVSEFSGEMMLTPQVLLQNGPTPTIPPLPVKQIDTAIAPLVSLFVGITDSGNEATNLVLERIARLERRVDSLTAALQTKESGPQNPEVHPAYAHRYAIIVGVSNYQSREFPPLRFPASDAQQLAKLLTSKYGFQSTLLLNATRAEIMEKLTLMAQNSVEDDLLVFYFSGHTIRREGANVNLLASDSTPNREELPIEQILLSLSSGKSKYMLSILEGCYSGVETTSMVSNSPSLADRTLICLSACGPDQVAFENQSGSIFTQALIKVLTDAPVDSAMSINDIVAKALSVMSVNDYARQLPSVASLGNRILLLPPMTTK